jgi:RNA polymerase sigma-70 factor, ECF subfamily
MASNHCNAVLLDNTDDSTNNNTEICIDWLMDKYGDDITRLAYSYVRNLSSAEDIAQNTFIKCYQHSSSFRGESSIKTWLYRIAINCCKDYLRSSYFKRISPTHLIQKFIKEPLPSTESVYFESDDSKALRECVFNLPSKYREVIILHYYDDLKIREIEEILELKGNTVKTRLRKARTILKEKLEKDRKGGIYFD